MGSILTMLSMPLFAQNVITPNTSDFTLFEPLETQDSPSQVASPASPRSTRGAVGASAPVFTLIGTSRIGDSQSAIVRHSSGESVRVRLREFGATPIPGFEDYAVVGAQAGNLSIRYPGSMVCAEFTDAGVSCSAEGNVAILQLTNAAPIVNRSENTTPAEENAGAVDGQTTEDVNASRNPFAVLRDRARSGDVQVINGDPNSNRFRPRRIDPADVPPGMRIVSTPFGDRLVEQ